MRPLLRFGALSLALAVAHAAAWFALFVLAWFVGAGELEGSLAADLLAGACKLLGMPAIALWTPWMSRNAPDAVEWLLFGANSLLWGVAGALLVRAAIRRLRSSSDSAAAQP